MCQFLGAGQNTLKATLNGVRYGRYLHTETKATRLLRGANQKRVRTSKSEAIGVPNVAFFFFFFSLFLFSLSNLGNIETSLTRDNFGVAFTFVLVNFYYAYQPTTLITVD